MTKGVLVDLNKCIGCRACQVACKQWNELTAEETTNRGTYENPPQLSAHTFTRIRFTEVADNGNFHWVFAKQQCMHCEHPACQAACLVGALQKNQFGAVVYDDNKCIGCRYCMMACPFGIPTFEWEEPLPWIRKCTFCSDRQGGGLEPACVTACPTDALKFGDRDDLITEAKKRIADHPNEYVDHIYGEREVGGTSWLYLSPVQFENIGFPTLRYDAVTINSERAMSAVPPALFAVAALMTGIYWVIRRKERLSQAKTDDQKDKEEATK